MNEKRPFIITFIGDLYFLGGLLSILALLFPNFLKPFGFYDMLSSTFLIYIMKMLLPIIVLIMSYGYLKLKWWGYWLMVIYNMVFLIIGIISLVQPNQLLFPQNILSTFIELIFILPTKKYFDKKFTT